MDAAATANTREILVHVPGRKSNRTEFFHVHPDADMALTSGVFIEESEAFFVTPSMRAERAVFLWPVPLPDWMEAEIDGDQARADSNISPAESVSEHISARRDAR